MTILLCCFELLCSCLDSPHQLLHPGQNSTTSRLVHAKCSILAWNLALVGCPLKTLHREDWPTADWATYSEELLRQQSYLCHEEPARASKAP